MNLIVDTHIFLWALTNPARIPATKKSEIISLANTIYVSAVSIAEIAIKASIGKLVISFDILEMIEKSGFARLDFNCDDAIALKDLPFHHKDPFDRMLIAQSLSRDYSIVTDDDKFSKYGCKRI
jgi:PIN domain nuclease of toxin-antitoxin system